MRRTGTSLVEVLIAIFIMALGLVSLMCLFPVGAVTMAKGVQNERAAQIAASAASSFRMQWKAMCAAERATMTGSEMFRMNPADPNFMSRIQTYLFAMDDPNAANTSFQLPHLSSPNYSLMTGAATGSGAAYTNQAAKNINDMAHSSRPSFPLMLDPVGWEAGGRDGAKEGWWLNANVPSGSTATITAIPRRTLPQMTGQKSQALRNFYLMDDFTFSVEQPTATLPGNTVERAGNYSYSYLLRRPANCQRSEVKLTVIVYHRRSIDSSVPEPTYPGTIVVPDGSIGETTPVMPSVVTLSFAAGDRPTIKQGSWILDATMNQVPVNSGQYFYQGIFYRVESVNDPIGNTVEVFLDRPLQPGGERLDPATGRPILATVLPRVFVVPESVLEVFEKGTVTMTSENRVN